MKEKIFEIYTNPILQLLSLLTALLLTTKSEQITRYDYLIATLLKLYVISGLCMKGIFFTKENRTLTNKKIYKVIIYFTRPKDKTVHHTFYYKTMDGVKRRINYGRWSDNYEKYEVFKLNENGKYELYDDEEEDI